VENDGVKIIAQLIVSEHPEVQSLALRAFNNIAENGNPPPRCFFGLFSYPQVIVNPSISFICAVVFFVGDVIL
jgi:hypothetical protein